MWHATLKGLIAHKVRLALTALAIVLGVAFVAGTFILTDTMNRAFDDLFRQVNRGTAVDVSGIQKFTANGPGGEEAGGAERVPASLLPTIQGVAGVRVAVGTLSGYAQLIGKDGKAVNTHGAPTFGVSWVDDKELSALTLRAGQPPQSSGQVVIDAATAEKHGFQVGDRTRVLLEGPAMDVTIVGIAGFGTADNLGGATLVAFDPQTAQKALNGNGAYDDVQVAAQPGVSPAALRDRIQKILPAGYEAKTGTQAAQDSSDQVKSQLKFFNIALLVFGFVALFVGAFIIFNTFSILVTQRTRELALLRALGATGKQVRRSVLAEAAIVGVAASAVGLVAGFGIAIGLQALLRGFGIELPTTSTQLLPRTIIAALIVGVGTTLCSSIAPAIRASRVAPVQALRESEPAAYRFSRRRTISGTVVMLLGAGALSLGLFGHTGNGASLVGLGAALVFLGVAVLSPLVARPLARAIGAPLRGEARRLGRENAMRNPKRTASTSAALMIGLGLVAFVSVFAASIKGSSNRILEETLKADYIVSSTQFTGFSPEVANELRSTGAFSAVSEIRLGIFGYQGSAQQVGGADPATLPQVVHVKMLFGTISALGPDDLMVWRDTAKAHDWKLRDVVPVQFARTGQKQFTIVGIYDDNRLLGNYVVSLDTYDANFTAHLDSFVLAKSTSGPSGATRSAVASVGKEFSNVKIEDQAQFRASQAKQIDTLLGLIDALLLFSIIIAVAGIINTLGLSVFERTREIGMLRAVGMSRRQVRSMVRWESVIIAVLGAILGTAIGILFGWVMVQALKSQGISVFTVPGVQLAIYVIVAGLFGVFAAIWPARHAARLDILRAITTE
jgi:putative ABC transport system permease protein